jgi:hypothetical protein
LEALNRGNYSTMSDEPELKITHRRLPHWRLAGATYFVTFRLAQGRLNADEITLVCDHIVVGDPTYYELTAVVVMPDHVGQAKSFL